MEATWMLANWRAATRKCRKEETCAIKSAGPDTTWKKNRAKYGWVHNFGFPKSTMANTWR